MDRSIFRALLLTASFSGIGVTAQAELVGQWTFNNGDSSDLTSTVGSHVFTEEDFGSNPTTTFNNDGTITLGSGRFLNVASINSTAISTMSSNATIWIRAKFDTTPSDFHAYAGLASGSDKSELTLSLAARSRSNSTLYFSGRTGSGSTIAPDSGFVGPVGSEYFEVAVVFDNETDSNGDPHGTQSSIRHYLNGDGSFARQGAGTTMQMFDAFMVGRVFSGAAAQITIDEVRVYDEALTTQQVQEISAVPVPEPGAMSLIALGIMAFGARTFSTRR